LWDILQHQVGKLGKGNQGEGAGKVYSKEKEGHKEC
jgi:hypothetical protein